MKLIVLLLLHAITLFSQEQIQEKKLQQLVDSIKLSTSEDTSRFKQELIDFELRDIVKAGELMKIGLFFYNEKKYPKSVEYLNEATPFLKSPEDNRYLYSLYFLSGNAYLNMWKNQEALISYQKALNANDASDLSTNEYAINSVLTNSNIAIIRRRMNQLEEAKKVNLATLNYINQNDIKDSISNINHVNILEHVSQVYLDLEKYDSVIYYSDKGISISRSNDYTIGLASLLTVQGAVFYHKNQFKKALGLFESSEDILLKNKTLDKTHYLNSIYYQAKCFYDQGVFTKATDILLNAINFTKPIEVNERIVEIYHLLADCYVKTGNTNQAIKWYDEHIRLKNIFLSEKDETLRRINESDKKNLDTQIQGLIRNQKAKNNYINLFVGILMAGSVILTVFLFRNYNKQKKNRILFDELIKKIDHLESNGKKKVIKKEIVLEDDKVNKIAERLNKLEAQGYYLHLDCNLRSMAKKLKTNATYLTKTINITKEKSFNDYINDLRIAYVLKRLKNDKTFRLFSIKSIAREIGYKSDYSFVKHFKAKTGLNPSYYIKNINKEEMSLKD